MIGILFMAVHGLAMLIVSFGFLMLAIYMAKYVSKEALLKYGVGLLVVGLLLSCVGFFSAGLLMPMESSNMMGNQYDGKSMMNRDNNSDEEKVEESTTSSTVEN